MSSFFEKKFSFSELKETVRAAFPFAFFVGWLLAFPMKGFLLAGDADLLLLWFLLPHIAVLLAIGTVMPSRQFTFCSSVGCIVTILLTGLFPSFPGSGHLLVGAIGVSAAFVSMRAVLTLQQAASVPLASAVGLAGGNLLLLGLMQVPVSSWTYVLTGLLLGGCFLGRPPTASPSTGAIPGLYFLFLFVFNTVSGLMYGFLMPRYADAAFAPGAELIIYFAAVALGLFVARGGRDRLLLGGVVLGMISFSLIQGKAPAFVNGSMFAMQGAAGFMDLFVLVLLLGPGTDPFRCSGYGLAAVCSGIAAGHLLAVIFPQATEGLVAAGNLVLALAFLTLHLLRGRKTGAAADVAPLPEPMPVSQIIGALEYDLFMENGPKGCRWKLTPQEKSVLEQVCMGRTYREAALILGITESSVKTYMKRIFAKADVTSKEGLLGKLMQVRDDSG